VIVNLNPTHKRLEGRRNGCCREWQNVEEIVPNFDPFAVARVWSKAENSAQRFGEREREREELKHKCSFGINQSEKTAYWKPAEIPGRAEI